MTRTIRRALKALKVIAFTAAGIAALAVAGNSDFTDAMVTEMKNNGSYYTLSEEHPQASDGQLVEIYLAERDNHKTK